MERGIIIALEGLDGCGKTTQLRLLAQALTAQGREVICTREPGGTALGEELRNLLLYREKISWSQESEALVFAAARWQNWQEIIEPALKNGRIVLCDRFYLSTLAYQGFGRGLSLSWLRKLLALILPPNLPLLNLILALPPEKCRRSSSPDRLEQEQRDFQERVWQGYQHLAPREKNCLWLSGEGRPEEVHQRLKTALQGYWEGERLWTP